MRLPPSSLAFARIIPGANQVSRFIHTAACTYGVSSTTAILRKRHYFPADFAFDLFRLVHVAHAARAAKPSDSSKINGEVRADFPPAALAFARSVASFRSIRGDDFAFGLSTKTFPRRKPTEKRVTCGSTSLSECRMPRSCRVPAVRVETRKRAPVRRSAHSLSSCPSALAFVLDYRTWNQSQS